MNRKYIFNSKLIYFSVIFVLIFSSNVLQAFFKQGREIDLIKVQEDVAAEVKCDVYRHLHQALKTRSEAEVRLLLIAGANPRVTTDDGEDALELARWIQFENNLPQTSRTINMIEACMPDTLPAARQKCELLAVLKGHESGVTCVAVDDNIIVTGSFDSTVRIYNRKDGICINILEDHSSAITAVAIANNIIVTTSTSGTAIVYNSDGELLFNLAGHTHPILSLAADNDIIVTGDSNGIVRVFNKEDGQIRFIINDDINRSVQSLAISQDKIVVGKYDARVYNRSGEYLFSLPGNGFPIHSLAIDNNIIVTGSSDKARIFNQENGQYCFSLEGNSGPVHAVVIGDDFIVTGRRNVRMYCKATGQYLFSLIGDKQITSLALIDDILVAGSLDQTATVYQLPICPLFNRAFYLQQQERFAHNFDEQAVYTHTSPSISQSLSVGTSDGNVFTLSEPFVAPDLIERFNDLSEQIDGTLSDASWNILQNLCMLHSLLKDQAGLEPNLLDPSTHVFNDDSVEQSEANAILDIARQVFDPDGAVIVVLFNAYLVFTKDKVTSAVISSLSAAQKRLLDKYYYLNFGKHLSLPKESIATVSLKEYLEFNKNAKKTRALDDPATRFALELKSHSLADLDGWQSLFTATIKPRQITVIDLSNNSLEKLESTIFKDFINLTKLSLAHNKLKSLPNDLLEDCVSLRELNLQHNLLHEVSPELLAPCNNLSVLLLEHNEIQQLAAQIIANKPNLQRIGRDTTTGIPDCLRRFVINMPCNSAVKANNPGAVVPQGYFERLAQLVLQINREICRIIKMITNLSCCPK